MSCATCPDTVIPAGVTIFVAYLGGPPEAPFAAIKEALVDDGIIRRFQPTVDDTGNIAYNRDVQPPDAQEGYSSVPDDPYVLKPIWPACSKRAYCVHRQDNGQLSIVAHCFCFHPECKQSTEILFLKDCNDCALRTPIK